MSRTGTTGAGTVIGNGAVAIRAAATAALAVWLAGCTGVPDRDEAVSWRPTTFADLPGWADDRHDEAVAAFARSCAVLARRDGGEPLGGAAAAAAAAGAPVGTVADWQAICGALPPPGPEAARAFFERWFVPYAPDTDGLFTGYYEPILPASATPSEGYATPLLARPGDLVSVSLGEFREEYAGERIAGRVVDGRLKPYPSRREIEDGALAGRGLEIAWMADPVDAFFLQIQGSGRLALDDGGVVRVGYAGQNGHPYTAIGRVLIEEGALTREEVSMQSIRGWLAGNPGEAGRVMNENASYVFFRRLTGDGPIGTQGVAVTPRRSLAVDRRFVPLSVPVWLDTTAPAADGGEGETPLRRLMVAQDTGGAIRGAVRGDVFWGAGDEAGAIAGRMKSRGRYYLLLPRSAAAVAAPSS